MSSQRMWSVYVASAERREEPVQQRQPRQEVEQHRREFPVSFEAKE